MLNLGTVVAYLNILADVLSSVAGAVVNPCCRRGVVAGGSSSVLHCVTAGSLCLGTRES